MSSANDMNVCQSAILDINVINPPAASVRFRFKDTRLHGLRALLYLHTHGHIVLADADALGTVLESGRWGDHPRTGTFTSYLGARHIPRGYFTWYVLPHLEELYS